MQSRVDDYYQAFVRAVARGRGISPSDVTKGMGQGRVLGAEAAISQKITDGIFNFDELLKIIGKKIIETKIKTRRGLSSANRYLDTVG
jgi:ClpP class serine protease